MLQSCVKKLCVVWIDITQFRSINNPIAFELGFINCDINPRFQVDMFWYAYAKPYIKTKSCRSMLNTKVILSHFIVYCFSILHGFISLESIEFK